MVSLNLVNIGSTNGSLPDGAKEYLKRCWLTMSALQWRHNEREGVSNHRRLDCLLNRFFRRRSKKTSKFCVTGLCAGNSPVTSEFSAQRPSNTENVSIWRRHHWGFHLMAISWEKLKIQYIPRNMHTVFALLCFVVVIHWLIFPYPSSLLHWHCGNLTIAPVPAKQPWWIWIDTSCEFIMNDCITTTKQSTTKPCAYFLGYTVYPWYALWNCEFKNTAAYLISGTTQKQSVWCFLPYLSIAFHHPDSSESASAEMVSWFRQ